MITNELEPLLAPQACPFCGESQNIIVNGHFQKDAKNNPLQITIDTDRGYSFCQCRNIFYTDWSNMEQGDYNENYEEKYNNDGMRDICRKFSNAYIPSFKKLNDGRKALEIGAVNPFVLDEFKKSGYETKALDIIKHNFGHNSIAVNFESFDESSIEKSDVIWASHIFEHFKDPIQAGRKCYNLLNDKGVLFVAMPDPFMIDWQNPYLWGHWHLREHHILWDMDSFAKAMQEIGFKVILKYRNFSADYVCICDYHVILQKETK